jgi:hypothetical protein
MLSKGVLSNTLRRISEREKEVARLLNKGSVFHNRAWLRKLLEFDELLEEGQPSDDKDIVTAGPGAFAGSTESTHRKEKELWVEGLQKAVEFMDDLKKLHTQWSTMDAAREFLSKHSIKGKTRYTAKRLASYYYSVKRR